MSAHNVLSLSLTSTYCNGWPQVRVFLNNTLIKDCVVNNELVVPITVDKLVKNYTLQIQRYGKTDQNFVFEDNKIVKDQVVELTSLAVDGVKIPSYVINNCSKFCFDNQTHLGSCYFSPNGQWEFEFQAPVVTWLLDQKILHESLYSDDYKFDWSYKLGPTSVDVLSSKYKEALDKINQIYDEKC